MVCLFSPVTVFVQSVPQEEKERKEQEEARKKQDEDAKKKKALTNMTQQYGGVQQRVSHRTHTYTNEKWLLILC